MIYLFILWLVSGTTILTLALYRKYLSRNEDDVVHLAPGAESAVQHQSELVGQLSWVDQWGKTLTIFEVLFGLALGAAWLYKAWIESTQLH